MAIKTPQKIVFVVFSSAAMILTNLTMMTGCKSSNRKSSQLNDVNASRLQGNVTKGDTQCPIYVSNNCARLLKAGTNVGINHAAADFLMKETGGRPIVVIGEWKRNNQGSDTIFVIRDIENP